MPYSGPDDPQLPSGVKKKSGHDRAQWVGIFNDVYRRTGDDGLAMREAYGATKELPEVYLRSGERAGRVLSGRNVTSIRDTMQKLRDLLKAAGIEDDLVEDQVKAFGAKCGVEVYEPRQSYGDLLGGAKSFAEADALDGADREIHKFQSIFVNIMSDDAMTPDQRAAAVALAAAEYSERSNGKETKERGLMARVRSLFGAKAEADDETQESLSHMHDDENGETVTHSHPCAMDDGHDHAGMGPAKYGNKARAEKATKTEDGVGGFTPADYADVPDDTSPSTWKLRLSDRPGHHDVTHVAGAITAMQKGGFRGNRVDLGSRKSGVVAKISSAITALDAPDDTKSNLRDRLSAVKAFHDYGDTGFGAFTAFKDTQGKWRWLATWSNNFYDREGEVFPEKAHKDYIDYVDRSGDFPELWLWHVPGSKCGSADMIDYDNGFCIATGTFDADKSIVAERLAKAKNLGVSHGYDYDFRDLRGGVYGAYRTFEISPLPAERAANEGTSFAAVKEAPMLTATKRDWLVGVVGEDVTKQVEENNRRMRKSLEDRGVNFKEFIDGVREALDDAPAVIHAPGFKSLDGGKTWIATNAKAGGGASDPPKDDDEEKEGEGDGEDAADGGDGAEAGAEKALGIKAITSAIKEALAPLEARLDAQDAKLDALKESDDAKIAAAWQRGGVKARAAKSATESDDNVVEQGNALVEQAMAAQKEADGDANPAKPYLQDLFRMVGAAGALE